MRLAGGQVGKEGVGQRCIAHDEAEQCRGLRAWLELERKTRVGVEPEPAKVGQRRPVVAHRCVTATMISSGQRLGSRQEARGCAPPQREPAGEGDGAAFVLGRSCRINLGL